MNKKTKRSLNYLEKNVQKALFVGEGPLADYNCKEVFQIDNWLNLFNNAHLTIDADWKKIYTEALLLPDEILSLSLQNYIIRQYEKSLPY
jgi:hypothetical protein